LKHLLIKISGREHYVAYRLPFICITLPVFLLTPPCNLQAILPTASRVFQCITFSANQSDRFFPLLRSRRNGVASGSDPYWRKPNEIDQTGPPSGFAAALTAAPAFAQAVIIAPMAPPPPRVEVMPAPRAGYVWDQGRWRWAQGRYVWVPGHWQPVRVGHRWVPGHWVQRGPNWRWIEGHWA
jgi:hypothetical protein